MRGGKCPRWLKGLLAGSLCFGVLLGAVVYGGHDQLRGEPQVMLILGCQVKPWGPSILLQDRLDEAIAYLKQHPDMTVIVSGGQGPDEYISEARCMQEVLLRVGIPAGQILLEDQSHNTHQNLLYSAQLMQQQGIDPAQGILVVSNGFHLARVRMLWERITGQGETLSTLAAPSTHVPSRIKMYIREPLALVKSYLLDR